MDLQNLWFVLIVVLWSGYFLLEGFDFGVGMLLPFLPRDDDERSAMFASIGPVWDGNEVWLVTAGGATFAAFPAWYATMFSGLYLALLARALLPDHPRDLVRVAHEEHEPALAECVAVGERRRELRRFADLGRRIREPAVRHPDQLQRRLRGVVLGPVQRLHPARRARGRCDLRLPRRHLPHAPHPGRSARASRRGLAAALGGRGGARRGVPDLDGQGRGRPQRQERLPAGAARGDRDRRARARGRPRPPAQPDLGVRHDRPGHDRRRGHALHEPLPAGDGLEHRLRATASRSAAPPRRTTRWRSCRSSR